jgi:hypothetical protein
VSEELRSYDEMKMGIECPKCGKPAQRIYSINDVRPSYGYEMTRFAMREKKRLSKDKFNGHI